VCGIGIELVTAGTPLGIRSWETKLSKPMGTDPGAELERPARDGGHFAQRQNSHLWPCTCQWESCCREFCRALPADRRPASSVSMKTWMAVLDDSIAEDQGEVRTGEPRIAITPGKGTTEDGFPTPKEKGGWAELCLMARARQIGLSVVKPYGDSAQYDVGIDNRGRLLRSQVKSTSFHRGRTFICNLTGPGHRGYSQGLSGFFCRVHRACRCLVHRSLAPAPGTSVSLRLGPGKFGQDEKYLEAWHLLRE
jgi:hypothetical protein